MAQPYKIASAPRSSLTNALNLVICAVDRRSSSPALANVALESSPDGMMIRTNNPDVEITSTLRDVLTDNRFAITVPARLAHALVTKNTSQNVTITALDDAAHFSFDGQLATMQTLPITDHPRMDFSGQINGILDLGVDALAIGLERVAHAMADEVTRAYLNGIFMHVVEVKSRHVLRIVATDGHRMSRHDICEVDPALVDMPGVIIPRKAVEILQKLLKPEFKGTGKNKRRVSPERVALTFTCTKIRVKLDDVVLTIKLSDDTYPDYKRITPSNNSSRLTVDASALKHLIKQVSIMSSERGEVVRLEAEDGRLTVSANNPGTRWTSGAIDVGYNSEPLTLGFCTIYLLEILKQIKGNTTIDMRDSFSPVLITGDGQDETIFVLMPLRV